MQWFTSRRRISLSLWAEDTSSIRTAHSLSLPSSIFLTPRSASKRFLKPSMFSAIWLLREKSNKNLSQRFLKHVDLTWIRGYHLPKGALSNKLAKRSIIRYHVNPHQSPKLSTVHFSLQVSDLSGLCQILRLSNLWKAFALSKRHQIHSDTKSSRLAEKYSVSCPNCHWVHLNFNVNMSLCITMFRHMLLYSKKTFVFRPATWWDGWHQWTIQWRHPSFVQGHQVLQNPRYWRDVTDTPHGTTTMEVSPPCG